jgi:hypothetical protein
MGTIVHIDIWDVTKILIDNGSHAEILFLATFDRMGFDRKQLRELPKPLYSFGGKRIKTVGAITLPVSFGTPKNPSTKYTTFDVVDVTYPYNAIFRRGLLNTFVAALHLVYLCLKIPATSGVITIFGSQQEARNIEAEGKFQKVLLDPRVLDKTICISAKTNQQDQVELLSFVDKNSNVFAWSTSDLVGVSKHIIEHRLHVSSNAKPKK